MEIRFRNTEMWTTKIVWVSHSDTLEKVLCNFFSDIPWHQTVCMMNEGRLLDLKAKWADYPCIKHNDTVTFWSKPKAIFDPLCPWPVTSMESWIERVKGTLLDFFPSVLCHEIIDYFPREVVQRILCGKDFILKHGQLHPYLKQQLHYSNVDLSIMTSSQSLSNWENIVVLSDLDGFPFHEGFKKQVEMGPGKIPRNLAGFRNEIQLAWMKFEVPIFSFDGYWRYHGSTGSYLSLKPEHNR